MDPKPRPNHRQYLEILRRMTPEQKAAKFFELSEQAKRLFREGLRKRFPELSEKEFHALYLEMSPFLRVPRTGKMPMPRSGAESRAVIC